jgi:hypothetical protein
VFALAHEPKAGFLKGAHGILVVNPRELRHAYEATSTSRTTAPFSSPARAARYSRIASRMLVRASDSVAPWDQHPGSPGTDTA